MMKRFSKKENLGITLIALVITIVVLIILATVAINLSLGNNGILNRARTATEQHQNAQSQEEIDVAKVTNEIDSYVDGNRGTVTLTDEEYAQFKNLIENERHYSITSLGTKTARNELSIDSSNYDTIYCEVIYNGLHFPIYIPTEVLTDTITPYFSTSGYNAGYWASISVSRTTIRIGDFIQDGVDRTANSSLVVYGINY